MLLVPHPYIASASYEPPQETVQEMADRIADEYDVSRETLHAVVECESQWEPRALGDHGHSRGLVQIYDDYWPDITDEQAYDPEFALTFLASNLADGNGHLWSCWRALPSELK